MEQDFELAKNIYSTCMSILKFTLDLEEQKYPEKGREDEKYKFFKKQVMNNTYGQIRQLFDKFEKMHLIEKTTWEEDVKNGYKPTSSGGSGFINTAKFNTWIKKNT